MGGAESLRNINSLSAKYIHIDGASQMELATISFVKGVGTRENRYRPPFKQASSRDTSTFAHAFYIIVYPDTSSIVMFDSKYVAGVGNKYRHHFKNRNLDKDTLNFNLYLNKGLPFNYLSIITSYIDSIDDWELLEDNIIGDEKLFNIKNKKNNYILIIDKEKYLLRGIVYEHSSIIPNGTTMTIKDYINFFDFIIVESILMPTRVSKSSIVKLPDLPPTVLKEEWALYNIHVNPTIDLRTFHKEGN